MLNMCPMEIDTHAANPDPHASGAAQGPHTTTADPTLGMFDFLKLLTVQMTTQDPMNPMENTEFIAQMAQFTSLQEMSKMNQRITELQSLSQWTNSHRLIGQQVQFTNADGDEQEGTVAGIRREENDTLLLVNGDYVPFSSIHSVLPMDGDDTQPQPTH